MRDSIQIRPAQPGDAEVAAVLLYSAYMHTHLTYPLREGPESGLIERLEYFFRRDGNRFSYQNIQVAEQSSEVVGLVLSFGGREEARLNAGRCREQRGIGSVYPSALCCHPADLPLSTSPCPHGQNIGKRGTGKRRNGEYTEAFSMNVEVLCKKMRKRNM